MEALIALSHQTIIYTIWVLQCWQQQELLTDFHPCWKVLSTDGHLPTEKLVAGRQNSPSVMLTYVTWFCFYNKQNWLWHFLIQVMIKCEFAGGIEFFNLAPMATDRYQIPQHSDYSTIPTLTKVFTAVLLLLLHLGCTNNNSSIHLYICCWFRVIRFLSFFLGGEWGGNLLSY